ncbi:MAG: hypothetical protein B5M46_03290 [Epsilonproteobacteria bacterium 4484_20]|nr:MAG: hypothetical protein B5M46_03290 [Epsilonproteobacteria bacterium 4484_20]
MAKVNYTNSLKNEYINLYRSCEAKKIYFDRIDGLVDKIISHRRRYENVGHTLGIPWYFIAAIHNMESGQNFSRHLHNGDPLSAKTRHVPKGRPKKGKPPFTWEESAVDALKLRRLNRQADWSLPRLLYELEGYNGWGYRLYHSHVLSPYLWSYSNHYISGKYIADGTWSDTARSRQCGAVLLIKRLEERGEITLSGIEGVLEGSVEGPLFFYSTKVEPETEKLQQFLNQFDGIALRVDGWPGKRTSSAVKHLFDFYLKGDPRND